MNKLLKKLKKNFILVVSLAENDPFLAEAAEAGGADAIKVHLNVHHRASKTLFKPWKKEKKNIIKILEASSIPVGIVPGAETVATLEEMMEMEELGIDFWDIFAHHLPTYLFKLKKMNWMCAIDYRFPLDYLPYLEKLGIQALETSIIPPEEYGQKLTARDLTYYQHLIKKIKIPKIIPTQRKIFPEDLAVLKKIGFNGIGIGAVVTGKNKNKLKKIVKQYKEKILQL